MGILQKIRADYKPPLPPALSDLRALSFVREELSVDSSIKELFPKTADQPLLKGISETQREFKPLRIGLLFSGGQAPGGHNVIWGLFEAAKNLHRESCLFGFLGGPSGLIDQKVHALTEDLLLPFRNQGGFDLIGSGRTKLETEQQLEASLQAVKSLALDGLVIIGGDDSNTNAALLAEYFLKHNCLTKIIGVPKTIDGDLQNPYVPISFGFDTACKIYSEMIGNIARDALSARKYTHFIKLMGRSASHITLECALATQPNLALIGEEVAAGKKRLDQIVKEMADLIVKRSEMGKNFGVILIPEGIVEFIPEVDLLIKELNHPSLKLDEPSSRLTEPALRSFRSLPETIQKQLLLERDPHGNVQLSSIETERLFIEKVGKELNERKRAGSFKGRFSPHGHFFGYEGRAAFPSNFDSTYCYALGMTAARLIASGATGYMAFVRNLSQDVSKWEVGGVPFTALLHTEIRKGVMKPVIRKALVDLKGAPFRSFAALRERCATEDLYQFPGPMQFSGDPSLTDSSPLILTH
jgi:diphosphate-dependent phosphofructokinase